jgi:uncharacterized protein YqjF (DUF2071 family)
MPHPGRAPEIDDRVAATARPDSTPLMHQSWGKLLFIHWRVPVDLLRPHIPEEIGIDTFDGTAWIAITPFTLWNVRPVYMPPLPLISHFHETNVRTYVYRDGVPGVWFFSLDANSTFNVLAARTFYHLPYKRASIDLKQDNNTIDYRLRRPAHRPAKLDARWAVGAPMPQSVPGSLEYFLTERYFLFTTSGDRLYRCRIYHNPWPLQQAELHHLETNLFTADGLAEPDVAPIVFGGGPVYVDVWPLEQIGRVSR